jgi:hypothetical protein
MIVRDHNLIVQAGWNVLPQAGIQRSLQQINAVVTWNHDADADILRASHEPIAGHGGRRGLLSYGFYKHHSLTPIATGTGAVMTDSSKNAMALKIVTLKPKTTTTPPIHHPT